MSTKYCIVYNPDTVPITVDDEEHQVFPLEFLAAQRSKVQEHISSGALLVVDPDSITNEGSAEAQAAKRRYEDLTAAWEKEKAEKENQEANKAEAKDSSAVYDDSSTKNVTKTTGNKSRQN